MFSKLVALAFIASQASAHFLVNYPASIGFEDDNEGTAPCGGFTPDIATAPTTTDFVVSGDTISLTGTHPTTTFLFRATTDSKGAGNWTNLLQPIQANGIGKNCEPLVPVPASFAGSKGFIQIIASSPDGRLFQCSAVNFITGSAPAAGRAGCTNATGVTLSYTNDASLTSLSSSSNGGTSSSTSNSSTAASSSSAAASATKSGAAGPGAVSGMGYGSVGTVAWLVLIAAGSTAARLL